MSETRTGAMRYQARVFCQQDGFRFTERTASSVDQLRTDLELEGITLVSAEAMVEGRRPRTAARFPLLIFCQQAEHFFHVRQ